LQATLRDCCCACFPTTESTVPAGVKHSQERGTSRAKWLWPCPTNVGPSGAVKHSQERGTSGSGVVRLASRRLSELHRSTVPARCPTNVGPSGGSTACRQRFAIAAAPVFRPRSRRSRLVWNTARSEGRAGSERGTSRAKWLWPCPTNVGPSGAVKHSQER